MATSAPTRFVETGGRRIAFRDIGTGPAIVLCLRFRGVLDDWDPAFLDALARTFRVVTFDYSGLGRSTGTPSYRPESLARDALDVCDALGLERVVIGGWSLGGLGAQVFAAQHADRTSHAVLIGTGPPGPQPRAPEPAFLATATKFENTLEDEVVLFFEPDDPESVAAARASRRRIATRTADRSPLVPAETYLRLLRERHDERAVFPDAGGWGAALASSPTPILAVCGDHDIMFPVENWYALNRRWRPLHVHTFPRSGHGPQHQFPELAAGLVANFVRNAGARIERMADLPAGV